MPEDVVCPFCKPPKKPKSKKKAKTKKLPKCVERANIKSLAAFAAENRRNSIFSLSPQEAQEHARIVAANQ
jgi:hypothetical protein